jgi:propane monooxygenase reductase subunit
MSFSVRVEPRGAIFEVEPGETVLDAALRQGVSLRYGCRQGSCSTCKYFLNSGDVDFGRASTFALSRDEREEGYALLCCATPLEDLEILESEEGTERNLPLLAPREVRARVHAATARTKVLWNLSLQLDEAFSFYPGQFVELGVPGEEDLWRAYSIANAPNPDGRLEFVVKRLPGGAFSEALVQLSPGDSLKLRGPFGASYLRPGDAPVLLVGIGSGIAPLRSILEEAAQRGDPRAFTLFYGVRTRADHPCEEELLELQKRFPRFDYRPCLSQPTDACRWTGYVGRVTQAIQQQIADSSPFDAYLCGAPAMCESVGRLLEAKGIGDGHWFSDPFFPAS